MMANLGNSVGTPSIMIDPGNKIIASAEEQKNNRKSISNFQHYLSGLIRACDQKTKMILKGRHEHYTQINEPIPESNRFVIGTDKHHKSPELPDAKDNRHHKEQPINKCFGIFKEHQKSQAQNKGHAQ